VTEKNYFARSLQSNGYVIALSNRTSSLLFVPTYICHRCSVHIAVDSEAQKKIVLNVLSGSIVHLLITMEL